MSWRNKRIMIVVAHPDDELLGIGATMHRLIKYFNALTHVVILGEGITSRANVRDVEIFEKELLIHRENIAKAQKAIGYHSVAIYDFQDNRFDAHNLLDIVKVVEKEKNFFKPEIIFTHHGGDLNVDHRITFQSVITATRPMEYEFVKSIITFETPSGTEWQASSDPYLFTPNMFFEIEYEDVEAKIIGMESYEFERRVYPHPRSPEALEVLAKRRGIQVGKKYAEAFQIVRTVI